MSSRQWQYSLYRSLWKGLDWVIPPFCAGCGIPGHRWCADCRHNVKKIDRAICVICGLPQRNEGVCETCLAERPHFRALRAWSHYEDPVRRALHKLKYRKDISLGEALAEQMVPFVKSLEMPADMVIPIPLGRKRFRERGYNQVAMIALPLALSLDLPYSGRGMVRSRETQSQVGLNRQQRKRNIHRAFSVREDVRGKIILLMDDISTTGATLSSGAEALLEAGAREVHALTVARAIRLEQG